MGALGRTNVSSTSVLLTTVATLKGAPALPGTSFVLSPAVNQFLLPMAALTGLPGITPLTPLNLSFTISAIAFDSGLSQVVGWDFAVQPAPPPIVTGIGRNDVVP